ncbi:hypothetical protein JXB27_03570 [Candidatus Woesearchaeota archaeon]|nr:hypothetical protein [Candidatus Woesearchaeota archaeon]
MKVKTISVILVLIVFISLYWFTGIFQANKIDDKDLKKWNFSNGVIIGAEEFKVNGSTEYCWLLIHGYVGTPAEMKKLAERISFEFNDTIHAPRLSGNGEVPSALLNKTIDIWYGEVSEDFDEMKKSCKHVNVLGSSFGGTLSLRLAEENDFDNLYLLNTFLVSKYEPLFIFSEILGYGKNSLLQTINDPEGRKNFITNKAMPFVPVKKSLSFIKITRENLDKITESAAVFHSKRDITADYQSSEKIYSEISSKIKEINLYKKSSHILLLDYDKEDIINKIIEFEKQNR